jgi:hypothetical protein
MTRPAEELVIKTADGEVVARLNAKGAALHGHCEWYDLRGDLVAYGFFKDGAPFTGTFLNWAKFFGDLSKEEPYEVTAYCRDWVTIFEASFRSESPKYEMVLEAYRKGQPLPHAP